MPFSQLFRETDSSAYQAYGSVSSSQGKDMKQLILTGMATEHVFMNGGGVEAYYLVFNNGEIRIPVPQETAEAVIAELYGKSEDPEENPREAAYEARHEEETRALMSSQDDDGVDQI